jgi:hypothetical protein
VDDHIALRRRRIVIFIYIQGNLVIDFETSDKEFEEFCLNMKSWADSHYSNNAIPSDIAFVLLTKLSKISAAREQFITLIKKVDVNWLKQILSKDNIVDLESLSKDSWHIILLELFESMDIERVLVLISGYKSYKKVDLPKLLANPKIKSMLVKYNSDFYKISLGIGSIISIFGIFLKPLS